MAVNKSQKVLVEKLQELAYDICHHLNFDCLFPVLLHPKLRFLSPKQLRSLHYLKRRTHTDADVARELLTILDQQPAFSTRRFIACLLVEEDHRGHEDIAKRLMDTISSNEANRIRRLVARVKDRSPIRHSTRHDFDLPWDSNQLVGNDIVQRDKELQSIFKSGETRHMVADERSDNGDIRILEELYQGLDWIHKSSMQKSDIAEFFIKLFAKCQELDSPNCGILKSRIYWAQHLLYKAWELDELAIQYASLATETLPNQ